MDGTDHKMCTTAAQLTYCESNIKDILSDGPNNEKLSTTEMLPVCTAAEPTMQNKEKITIDKPSDGVNGDNVSSEVEASMMTFTNCINKTMNEKSITQGKFLDDPDYKKNFGAARSNDCDHNINNMLEDGTNNENIRITTRDMFFDGLGKICQPSDCNSTPVDKIPDDELITIEVPPNDLHNERNCDGMQSMEKITINEINNERSIISTQSIDCDSNLVLILPDGTNNKERSINTAQPTDCDKSTIDGINIEEMDPDEAIDESFTSAPIIMNCINKTMKKITIGVLSEGTDNEKRFPAAQPSNCERETVNFISDSANNGDYIPDAVDKNSSITTVEITDYDKNEMDRLQDNEKSISDCDSKTMDILPNGAKNEKRITATQKPDCDLNTEELYDKIRDLLNMLMPGTCKKVCNRIKILPINTLERLQGLTDLIFDQVTHEPNFIHVYVQMCRDLALMQVLINEERKEFVNFRELLIAKCLQEFEKIPNEKVNRKKKLAEIEACADPEIKRESFEECKEKNKKSKGIVQLIGELFKQQMITAHAMVNCIRGLLVNKDDESLECLCILLNCAGEQLDAQVDLGLIFGVVKNLIDTDINNISKAVLSELKKVIKCRERWTHFNSTPFNPPDSQRMKSNLALRLENRKHFNCIPLNPQEKRVSVPQGLRGLSTGSNVQLRRPYNMTSSSNAEPSQRTVTSRPSSSHTRLGSFPSVNDQEQKYCSVTTPNKNVKFTINSNQLKLEYRSEEFHRSPSLTESRVTHRQHKDLDDERGTQVQVFGKRNLTEEFLEGELYNFIQEEKPPSNIMMWLEENIGTDTRNVKFIRILVNVVIEASITNFKLDMKVLEMYNSLLAAYVGKHKGTEIECLCTVHTIVKSMDYPNGLLLKIFEWMREKNIVSRTGYLTWRSKTLRTPLLRRVLLKELPGFFSSFKSNANPTVNFRI